MSEAGDGSSVRACRPSVAGFWSFFWPGLGHYYAGRGFGYSFAVFFPAILLRYLFLEIPPRFLEWRVAIGLTALGSLSIGALLVVSGVKATRELVGKRPPKTRIGYLMFLAATAATFAAMQWAVDASSLKAAKNFRVPNDAMAPVIMSGDRVWCNLLAYKDGKAPARGDIVVFKYPRDPKINYVKRVIGVPGDRLRIDNDVLMISGQPHDFRPKASTRHTTWPDGGAEVEVPADSYFVVGDNLNDSTDSRIYGAIKGDAVICQAHGVVFATSPDHWPRWDRFLIDVN